MYYNHYMYYVLAAWSVSAFHLVVPVLYHIFYQLYTNTKKEIEKQTRFCETKRRKTTKKCYVRACWPGLGGRQLVNCLNNGYFCNVHETAARKNPKYNRENGQYVSHNIHTANYTYINYK